MDLNKIFEYVENIFQIKLFTVNDSPITILSLIIFLLIFFGLLIFSKTLANWVERIIFSKTKIDKGTAFVYKRIIYYLLISASIIFALQFIGIDLSGLAVIFGFLSVGIGFGLQNITSNFISGIILLFEKPIKVGDRVTVGETVGDVISINMRSTTVRTFNNITIIVPNSEFISTRVTNWSYSDPKVRLDINVGVSYGSDLSLVKSTLYEVAQENQSVLKNPKSRVLLLSFGDSAWDMELQIWLSTPQDLIQIKSDINSAIVKKFREHNIEIPFPQRDVHLKSKNY